MKTIAKTLATAVIATASVGAFAGELYDPTAGQPTSTVSQTNVSPSRAPYIVIEDNETVLAANPEYRAERPRVEFAGLTEKDRREIYSNS
jgi:hypothetical protein